MQRLKILGSLLTLALVFLGVGQAQTLVVGIESDIETLDPGNHRHRTTQVVLRNIFNGLVTRTADMQVVPELALSWERISETEWIFYLRPGVTWHDGAPFTAEDVKFTIDRTVKPGMIGGLTSPRKSLLDPVIDAEVLDTLTVKIITGVPFPALLTFLAFHEMVPKHYVERVGDAHFAENPIGTGPFRFVRWDKGVQIILERYENYWGGPAKVVRVVFRALPETSTRIAALRAGEIHLATWIPIDLIPEIEADPNLVVMSVRGTRSAFLEMNVTRPPFDDLLVRRAIAHAVNVDLIVQYVLGGRATPIPAVMSPDSPFYLDLPRWPYDPQLAKSLLAQAGYPKGFSVTIDCADIFKDVALVIAEMLRDVGLEAKVQVWEWGILRTKLLNREREMWVTDWGNATLDPLDIMIPKLKTGERGNYSGYSSALYDGLMHFAEWIAPTPELRKAAYQIAQALVHYEAPIISLYVAEEVYGVSRKVQGFVPRPDSWLVLHEVELRP